MITANDVLISVLYVDVKNGIVNIPNGVKGIADGSFSGCSGLTSVTIPDSVTSIGEYAFCHCDKLTSVTIGNRVTSIGECAFYDTNLKSKVANYKAFRLKGDKLFCLKKEYREGVKHRVKGVLELSRNGIHYCTNLFDIFNYYHGELDKDIAIYEIEVGDKVLKNDIDSKCCTNSCVLKKRLYREDIIRVLNERS